VVTIRTTSLTFNKYMFCPHSVFMCFVWFSEQTAITSLYSINWLVCITETECVYCAVRTTILLSFKAMSSVWQQTAAEHTMLLLCIQNLRFANGCLEYFCSFPKVLCANVVTLSKMKPWIVFMWFPIHYLLIILSFNSVSMCATCRHTGGAEV